ncbi:hypothetical protein BM536_036850 [Streptomyces phaeoluteigriseus]|uniref:Uncharacterized protein n=1 Tax=Streptomyces phaeoluteigriseus TaxID=114686 RepID=A0A1V6MI78_9ACTN|nr:hypothetical protein [Streptomyces phaeoluteigriseus]OQD52007.1 hypothetical protein BM536_036850 [Streptomyces phaeoluteigriseus]
MFGVHLPICNCSINLRRYRDVGSVPETQLWLEGTDGMSSSALESVVDDFLGLCRSVDALSPAVALDAGTIGGHRIDVPVVPDAFGGLLDSLGSAEIGNSFRLHVEAGAGAGVDWIAAEVAKLHDTFSDYQFRIHVDDAHVVDLFCSASPEEEVELYWDSGPVEWIQGTLPNGLRGDDGMLYALELTEQEDGLELVAQVVFDHIDPAEVIAWLEARSDVSMEYLRNS